MAAPITNKPAVTVNGYAQANAGVISNAASESYANLGATLGGEVNYKGTYLRGEAGAGTALTGKLELGHEFDIGKNMGLDLSAKAKFSRSNNANNFNGVFDSRMNAEINGVPYEAGQLHIAKGSWKPGETRLGGQAELTFKSKTAKFGVGLEGGIRRSTSPDINVDFRDSYSVTVSVEGQEPQTVSSNASYSYQKNLNKRVGYITPTVSAEVQLGKKSNFSFVANADLYQGQAGIRYTF